MNPIDKRYGETLLSDLLPYQSFDPEKKLFWLKDGSASQTFSLTPKNCMNMTEDELERLRTGLTSALSQTPENSFIQFFMIREKTESGSDLAFKSWIDAHQDVSTQSSPNSQRLFDTKKEMIEKLWHSQLLLQTKIYVSLRTTPFEKNRVGAQLGAFSHLAFGRNSKLKRKTQTQIEIETSQISTQFRQALELIGFETADVNAQELLKLVFNFLNPKNASYRNIEFDEHTSIAEKLALSELVESKKELTLGRTPIRIGTLKTLPESSIPALLSHLATIDTPHFFVLTVFILPQTPERDRLSRKQRLTQGLVNGNQVRNLQAETQLQDIEDTMTAMISSGEKLLAMSAHTIVFEEAV